MRTIPHPAAVAKCGPTHATRLSDALRKRYENARATACWLYGISLEVIDGDDGSPQYVATLHALTRRFRTIAEVEGWLHALDEHEAPRGELARFVEAQGTAA